MVVGLVGKDNRQQGEEKGDKKTSVSRFSLGITTELLIPNSNRSGSVRKGDVGDYGGDKEI
ncbi:MAG: hypothetical protein ABIJ30_10085 [bacterium]